MAVSIYAADPRQRDSIGPTPMVFRYPWTWSVPGFHLTHSKTAIQGPVPLRQLPETLVSSDDPAETSHGGMRYSGSLSGC